MLQHQHYSQFPFPACCFAPIRSNNAKMVKQTQEEKQEGPQHMGGKLKDARWTEKNGVLVPVSGSSVSFFPYPDTCCWLLIFANWKYKFDVRMPFSSLYYSLRVIIPASSGPHPCLHPPSLGEIEFLVEALCTLFYAENSRKCCTYVYRQNMNPPAPTHQYQRKLKRKRRHVPKCSSLHANDEG